MTLRGHAVTVAAYGGTHTGRVRAGNEDAYLIAAPVFAVADGMGGHQAGEIASDAALEPLRALEIDATSDADDVSAQLADAVRAANSLVVERARSDPSLQGMGTTLTAVAVCDGRLVIAHVGDSRAYLLRDGEPLSQLTTDHTLVERLVQEGRLSRDEVASHPQRNVITRAIGHEATVEVEVLPPITLRDGDQVLLCSDGLSGPVDDGRITKVLKRTPDGDAAVRALLGEANAAGGPDNITAVLIRIGDHWREDDGDGSAGTTAATQPIAAQPTNGDGPAADAETDHDATADDGSDSDQDATGTRELEVPSGGRRAPTAESAAPTDAPDDTAARRRVPVQAAVAVLAVVVVLAALAGGGWLLLSRSYYVGEHQGMLAIYQGTPQTVAGISTSWVVEEEITTTPIDAFPQFRQEAIADGLTAQSLNDARRIVADLQSQLRDDAAPAAGVGEPLTEPSAGP